MQLKGEKMKLYSRSRSKNYRNAGELWGVQNASRHYRSPIMATLIFFAAASGLAVEDFRFFGKPANLPATAAWVVNEFSEGENTLDLSIRNFGDDNKWSSWALLQGSPLRCYRVANRTTCNQGLRQRGDVTVWLSPDVEADRRAQR